MSRSKTKKAHKPQTNKQRYLRVLVLVGLCLAGYLMYLNNIVSERFQGSTWVLPSRVFARPLEIYPGIDLSVKQLEYELRLSNFQRVTFEPLPGQYRLLGESIEFHTRPFKFSDQAEPARQIQLFFDENKVDTILDSKDGKPKELLRIPPVVIGSYFPNSGEDRLLLAESELPDHLIDILVAVEDRQFFDHYGVSPSAILRALVANIKAGRAVQGGSTLTQQLAKNLFLTPEKSLVRKINEAFMSLLLEARLSKKSIITAYINEVFLMQHNNISIHGFALASRLIFQRTVDHLEPHQMALLVGMVKGPSQYNPFKNPKTATKRRNVVLEIMFKQGLMDEAVYGEEILKPLGIVKSLPAVNAFPAYLDLVKRQLQTNYSGDELSRRGLRIFTTFDPFVQLNLERGLENGLNRFDQPELQAAVVVADYLTGDITALVSDNDPSYPGFNRAVMAQRPIGSLIKPLLLYGLLENGLTLASVVSDEQVRIEQSNGDIWQPRNFDRELHGKMTLYNAFVRSYNLPFVKLGVEGGLQDLADNLEKINLLKHEVIYPSLLLGTTEMSAFEAAQMFQVIANNGYFTPLTTIRSVTDIDNTSLTRVPVETYKMFNQTSVLQVQRAMVAVSESGTARYLASRFKQQTIAGKTGTTNELRDSWFAGFTQRQLTVVWLGNDDNTPIHLTGSSGALRVWADVMQQQGFQPFKLSRDKSLKWAKIHPIEGGITRTGCQDSVLLPFPENSLPSNRSSCP